MVHPLAEVRESDKLKLLDRVRLRWIQELARDRTVKRLA